MQDLIFQDNLYFTFTSEQAEWAVCMWNKVLLYRGIMSGRIPSEFEMTRLKQAAPGVLNGSPQEDLGYIMQSASRMYSEWD
jgi:hypothetical protein